MNNLSFKQILLFAFTASFLTLSCASLAQEKKKALEISTASFDQFSIRYKFGNEKYQYRISSFTLKGNSSEQNYLEKHVKHLTVGMGFGVEFPKQLNDKLSLYYGPELRGSYNNYNDKLYERTQNYSISAHGILGFAYHFNNTLRLGAEIDPGFTYYHTNDEYQTLQESLRFDFLNYGAAIVLGYNF